MHFNHPGIAITASSGDNGYGVSSPAASRYVTAVGGTSLTRGGGTRGWTESAWSGAGSGCCAYEAKPAWQTDTGCARRTVADVSAVADPNTGVAVLFGGLVVHGRRHERVVADHRERVRARRQRGERQRTARTRTRTRAGCST